MYVESGRSLRACSRATPSVEPLFDKPRRACCCNSASSAESSRPDLGVKKPSLPCRLLAACNRQWSGGVACASSMAIGIPRAGLVDRRRAVADPLPPAIHRHADQELHLGHLERRGVPMPHEVADQRAIVRHRLRPRLIAHPGRLHHGLIVAHRIDEAHEAVVEHRKFLPAKRFDGGDVNIHEG